MGTGRQLAAASGSAAEFRDLLDEALSELDADEKAGPLLRAAGLRMRLRVPRPRADAQRRRQRGARPSPALEFSDAVDWEPKLKLQMDSQIANAYLQGKESLAIAIARGRVRFKGDTRCALSTYPRCACGGAVPAAGAPGVSAPPRHRRRPWIAALRRCFGRGSVALALRVRKPVPHVRSALRRLGGGEDPQGATAPRPRAGRTPAARRAARAPSLYTIGPMAEALISLNEAAGSRASPVDP